jgi:hypothetical protein
MTVSKTSVQSIDLDDLERQLREVAVSSLPKQKDDPLSELARIVGREKPLRSIPGGRAQASQSVSQPVIANDTLPTRQRLAETSAAPKSAQAELDLASRSAGASWSDQARGAPDEQDAFEDAEQLAYDEDEIPVGEDSQTYSEEWESGPAEEDVAYEDEGGAPRFDAVEQVPGAPALAGGPDASTRRGFMSPRALAITVPILLALIGAGAATVMRGGPSIGRHSGDAPVIKADDSPVKVQPAKAADSDQTPSQAALDAADPLSKPSQVVVARPEQPVDVVAAVKDAQPRTPTPAKPPASSGIVIVSGPSPSQAPPAFAGSAPKAAAASPSVPSAGANPAPGASPSATAPGSPSMPATAADVPLPQPPQPSSQGSSVFGSPRRVSTVAVKPDGTIVPNAKPQGDTSSPPKRPVVASADPAATPAPEPASPVTPPAAKKPVEPARAKPAADSDADAKPPKPAVKPKPKAADTTPATSHAAVDDTPASGGPLSITPQGHHRRTVVASADPQASPREAAAASQPNTARGESGFSIQLASSPSETDARATLSRLQRQFPNMLGGGSVYRANLGNKGIYYRVRVGPLSRDAADKLCSHVKAGGADCILTRG